MKPILLTLKAQLRYTVVVFWGIVFPVFLYFVFIVLLGPQGGTRELLVYVYNKSSDVGQFLGDVLKGINAEVVYVGDVGDPRDFVLNKTFSLRRAVALINVEEGNLTCLFSYHCKLVVEVYSTYEVMGGFIAGVVEGALYSLLMPRLLAESVNVTTINLSGSQIFEVQREVGALRLTLSLSVYAVAVALSIFAMWRYVGFDKRSFLLAVSKWKFFTYLLIAALLFNLIEVLVLAAVAKFTGLPMLWILSPYFWIAFLINFVFASGIAILIDAFATRRGEVIYGGAGVVVFLPLVFLTGYYLPAELFPKEVLAVVSYLPTFGTRVFAEGAAIHGLVVWSNLALPVAVSIPVFALAVALHPIIRRV